MAFHSYLSAINCKHAPVETNVIEIVNRRCEPFRNEAGNCSRAPNGDEQTQGTTDQTNNYTFGEQLPDQLPAARTDCRAYSHFTLSRKRARNHQACDVDTGEQHHEPDST